MPKEREGLSRWKMDQPRFRAVLLWCPCLLVAVVIGDLEVPKLGLHVVVLLGDPAVFFSQLLIALFVSSVRLLVSLKKGHNKQNSRNRPSQAKLRYST